MLFADRLALMRAAASYGDAVRIVVGPKTLYIFNHPDSAKYVLADNSSNYHKGIGLVQARRTLGDGLLTSDGELWRKQRKVMQPAFQPTRIASQARVVGEEAAALVDRLRRHTGGVPVDVVHELTGFSLGVLGRALLDADLSGFETIGEAFQSVQDQAMTDMLTLGAMPVWSPLPRQSRFRRAHRYLQGAVDQLVEERSRSVLSGRADDDALSKLIGSVAHEPDAAIGRKRLRDELVTLLLAGHDTTASTLGWTCHLVSHHPEVAARLNAEAVEVLGDRLPTYDDLRRLRYTTAVVEEVMRLYPPVWILPRRAQQDDIVAGFHVPAGSEVLICPYTMHRHPAFWDHPLVFDPDRFATSNATRRPRYAYLPFGGGPRFCIGSSLGTMEAVFALALISRELRLVAVPDHPVVAEAMLSLRIRGGLPMRVAQTDDQVSVR
jgi:cytochrome P450